MQTVQMFEVIAETQPNDIQSLEILKEAYLGLDRDADAVAVSKRIAGDYVLSGQVSSAILEFEGILQKFPDDADALAALQKLEGRMAGPHGDTQAIDAAKSAAEQVLAETEHIEDGNEAMLRFFQENQLISEKDAQTLLAAMSSAASESLSMPNRPSLSLLGLMSDRGIAAPEKSIGLVAQKTLIPYLPLGLYEVDSACAALFDKEFCLQSLVLPFDRISRTLLVATLNPFDAHAKRHVEQTAGSRVQWYLVQPLDMIKQLKSVFRLPA